MDGTQGTYGAPETYMGDDAGLAYTTDDYGNTVVVAVQTIPIAASVTPAAPSPTPSTPATIDDSLAYLSGNTLRTATGLPLTPAGQPGAGAGALDGLFKSVSSVPTWAWIAGGGLVLVLMMSGGGSRRY